MGSSAATASSSKRRCAKALRWRSFSRAAMPFASKIPSPSTATPRKSPRKRSKLRAGPGNKLLWEALALLHARLRAHHERPRAARFDIGWIEQMLRLELGLRPFRACVECDPQEVSVVPPVARAHIAVELLLAANQTHSGILGHRIFRLHACARCRNVFQYHRLVALFLGPLVPEQPDQIRAQVTGFDAPLLHGDFSRRRACRSSVSHRIG